MKTHQKFLVQHCYCLPPVDIESIIASLGVNIVSFSFDKIDGMCLKEDDGWTIVVNTNISLRRRRFTLAHELKHVLAGEASFLMNGFETKKEQEANAFAGRILVPALAFIEAWKQNKNIGYLSRLFGVSQQVIKIRLKEIGI